MKLQLGPEIISSYKRLAYQAWYALAEFVDNSTQAYFNNRETLDAVYAKEGTKLTVEINTGKDAEGECIRIADNSIGMSERELKNAVYIGKPPLDTRGRSRYGLGLKTGASWFGDLLSIDTKKLNDTARHKITVDVPKVASGRLNLPHKKSDAPAGEHETTILIHKLHRRLTGRALGKAKNYLSSLYRRDISDGVLILKINGEVLSWDADVDKRLLVRRDGTKAKKNFRFKVGKKQVYGWAGVLEKGSRRSAGFSIIQANRVITGWPDSYRPETLYGSQEGGSNDLVNQRLFGELVLEGFDVSHTKDQILFEDGEQEDLEAKLKKHLSDLRQLALTHRKEADERIKRATDTQRNAALNVLEHEIKSHPVQTFFQTFELPADSLIKKTNEALKDAVVSKADPDADIKIGTTTIRLYLARDLSPNDPYVIIESTKSKTSVIVIINVNHPHWAELSKEESILNFIRHCTYDGVAEHKAFFVNGKIEPDTVKLIKDNLLRRGISVS
ncbi:MAG TPA: ATP-binding protein [Candidatus Acidoferrum sp.]|jgi:hypothetical protein|nr:ATP-binding protein [Candidatus Acidoferrum sp.]